MIELIQDLADVMPHFGWVLAVPLVCLVVQLLALRSALRERRRSLQVENAARAGDFGDVIGALVPPRWPAALIVLSVLAIPAVAVWSMASARGLCLSARDQPSYEAAAMFSRGLGGMIDVVPWAINLLVPCVLLATFSVSLRVSTRARLLRLRTASKLAQDDVLAQALLARRSPSADDVAAIPFLLLGLGLLPVLSGAWAHTIRLIQGYSGVFHLPAEQKGPLVLSALDEAHALFAARAWLAYPGVAVAALVSALLLARWRRQQPTSPAPSPTLSWRATLVWSGLCLATALALFRLAAPFRAENELPWPAARLAGEVIRAYHPDGPPLEGPDEIQRSPVLQLWRDGRVSLDGYVVDLEQFGDTLRTARQNYRLLHPSEPYAGTFLVMAASDTPTGVLAAYLTAAAHADHAHALFTFTRRESQDRPILGPLTRVLATAASATLLIDEDEPEEGTILVRPSEHANYGELARRLVELRGAGEDVALAL